MKKNKLTTGEFFFLVSFTLYKAARTVSALGRGLTVLRSFYFSAMCSVLLALNLAAQAYAEAEPGPFAVGLAEPERVVFSIDLPAQSVAESLNALARQTGTQFLFPYTLTADRHAPSIRGRYTVVQAVQHVLKGTGLTCGFDNGFLVISDRRNANKTDNQNTLELRNMNSKKNILATTIGFFMGAGFGSHALGQSDGGEEQGWVLEEIVVTATKRATSLQDTSMAISALSGETIDRRGLVGMEDYLRTLPGVSMQDRGASQNSVVIRGIAANPQAEKQAVGTYFGETPVTGLGSATLAGAAGNADLKLVDIERVEVLRGPQGTLYGSGSMGGTVRVIPNRPNSEQMEGMVATRYSHTEGGDGDNTMIQGVINVPVSENELAFRAVAYRFENAGVIDNVSSPGQAGSIAFGGVAREGQGVGEDEYTGLRLAALWTPLDELSVTLSHIQQEIEQEGIPEVNYTLGGDYQQIRLGVGPNGRDGEFMANDLKITNLVVEYDLGWGSVISSSSWVDYEATNNADFSLQLPASLPMYVKSQSETDVFIEELRLTSLLDGPFQFMVGVYYEDSEAEKLSPVIWSGDPDLDDPVAVFGPDFAAFDTFNTDVFNGVSTEQTAFFGEASYELTEQIMATLGARFFEYDQSVPFSASGILASGSDTPELSDSGNNFRANISYTPSDTVLVYGQWAEGFRLGSPAVALLSSCDTDGDGLIDDLGVASKPTDPDELESFEIGVKSSFADDRVTLNASVYRIDWDGIPVSITAPSCSQSFAFNAGKSVSEGVELELQARVTEQLQLDLSASYGEAKLTEDIPGVVGFGADGDDLPGSSDYNISLGIEYDFTVAGFEAFTRADYAYVGEYYHNFTEEGEASGGYGQLHLKAGVSVQQVNIDVFIQNVTDENGFTWIETVFESFGDDRAYRVRPRTVGLNVSYHF